MAIGKAVVVPDRVAALSAPETQPFLPRTH